MSRTHLVFSIFIGCAWLLCSLPLRAEMSPFFDDSYLQGSPPARAVLHLWQEGDRTGQAYTDLLRKEKGFNGLYFRAEGWESLRRDAYEYKLGIDLELYDNGRHEGRRTQAKKIVESRVQYLQLLNDMSHRASDENRYNLHRLELRLQKEWLQAKLKLTTEQLQTARSELKAGFLTRDEFADYVTRQTEAELRYQAVASADDLAMPSGWLVLLNRMEKLELLPENDLIERAYRQDYGLLLQEQFIERAQFHPQWRDDLEARLYLEERYNDYNRREDLVVGVRVRLPLDKPRNRDDLIELEIDSYREQAQAMRVRIRQRILQQHRAFRQHQAMLNGMMNQRIQLLQEIRDQQEHARKVIPSLPYTPEKQLRVLARTLLDLSGEIRKKRLQLLGYMIDLADLTRDARLETLLRNPPPMEDERQAPVDTSTHLP